MAIKWKKDNEFRPDRQKIDFGKKLTLTNVQRQRLAKWGLYAAVIVLALVLQDVIMSQMDLLGSTTDLVPCVLILIAVMEGTDAGTVFMLIASILYYFSGSAPGPYVIALLTFLGAGAALLRQAFLHRNKVSILLCAGMALVMYEIGLFVVGLFLELTHWGRLPAFVLAAGYSLLVMIPLYNVIYKIGVIGGSTWKE